MSRTSQERVQDILEAVSRCERYRERFDDADSEVVEMRNILIHEYFGVDTGVVTRTLERDLLPLAKALRAQLGE